MQIDLAFRKGADKRLGIGQQHPNNGCRASLGIVPNFCDQVIVNSLGLALVPRLRKGLDEVSALRSNRSTEEAGKWAEKIKSVNQEVAKANAIVASGRCSVQQLVEPRPEATIAFAFATS